MTSGAAPKELPAYVSRSLGFLLDRLLGLGFAANLDAYYPDSPGHYEITFSRGDVRLKIQHDRGQMFVYGGEKVLGARGLGKAFSGWKDLETPLMNWLGSVA